MGYRYSDDNMVDADDFLDQKGNSGVAHILVIIFIVALLAVGGYFLYTKVITPKLDEMNKEKEVARREALEEDDDDFSKTVSLEVESDIVVKLMKYVDKNFLGEDKLKVSDLDSQVIFVKSIPLVIEKYGEVSVSRQEFNDVVSSMYGVSYPFKNETYTSKLCVKYKYDEEEEKYQYVSDSYCGGTSLVPGGEDLIKAVKAERDSDIITIMARVLFFKAEDTDDGYKAKYYSDYAMTKEVSDLSVSGEYDLASNTTDNLSKGALYKLTYQMDHGNYVFVSSEVME